MVSLTKAVFIIIGLYLVITNLIDMTRDTSKANIGVQAVSAAIGGGLIAYGMSYRPVTSIVTEVLEAVKGTAKAAERVVTDAVKPGGPKP